MPPRSLRFFIDVTSKGSVIARGVDCEIEIAADNVADLRDRLAEVLQPFGFTPTLVRIRDDPEKPNS